MHHENKRPEFRGHNTYTTCVLPAVMERLEGSGDDVNPVDLDFAGH